MTTISSIDAKFAQDQVRVASTKVTSSVANLVSGNKSDAGVADLSVGTVLAARVGTLRVAVSNAGQAKSLLETAKGGLNTILGLLQQQKNLAVKSSDDSLSDNERAFLDQEFQAIVSEVDRISANANFNGKKLLDGSISGNAGTNSATGISNEQYSLLSAKDTTATGTVASGALQNSLATVAENYITFGEPTGDGNITVTIDSDLLDGATAGGSTAAQTVTVAVLDADTAAEVAAKVVAAISTAVSGATDSSYSNFAQFDFASNSSNGVVTIKAKEAGAHLNGYGFSVYDGGFGVTATLGTGNQNIENIAQTQEFVFSTGAVTTGTDGIFKAVAANNIADTKFSGVLDFTAVGSGTASTINGIKRVLTLNIETANTAGDDIAFGGVTFNFVAADAAVDSRDLEIDVYASKQQQAEELAARLNSEAALGNLTDNNYIFTAVDSSGDAGGAGGDYKVVATATNFGTPDTSVFTQPAAAGAGVVDIDNAANGFLAGSDSVADVVTVTIQNGSAVDVGQAFTFTIARNTTTTAYTDADIAQAFYDEYTQAGDITSAKRLFDASLDTTNGRVTLTAKDAGTDINDYTININRTLDANFAVTLGDDGAGDTVLTDGGTFTLSSTAATLGTNKSIAPSDLTFDANLLGELTNLKGTFTLGAGNDGATDDNNNTVQFTVDVNGQTYTSNTIQLFGSSAGSFISNTILAGTKITFQSASGPVDASGAYTNNGFQLNVESAITLASVTNASTGQNSLTTVVNDLQTQLDSIALNQNRSFALDEINASSSDHRITAAVGTILEGLRGFDSVGTNRLSYNAGDIKLISDQYGDTGTHGDIRSFTVDRNTDTISTIIGGETYTAYLNSGNAPSVGGIVAFGTDLDAGTNNGTYSSNTKIITLGSSSGETAKLNFFSANTLDGKVLQINLGNVAANISQININSDEGEAALESALNAVFNVSSNDSLSFQVGAASTDIIGVSIGSAKTVDIYKDADGVSQTLDIRTIDKAIEAGDVIDIAIRNVISLISDVSAAITSFNSSIQNNQASIQNADAARSKLLDTDYTVESTQFAEARVRVDAATAVLTQVNSRIQNLLGLLRQ